MENNLNLGLEKAKNYCFLLLKFRLRSEYELLERLKNKKFDCQTSEKAVSFLKEKGFIERVGGTRGSWNVLKDI